MTSEFRAVPPSSSADVFTPPESPEGAGWAPLSLLPLAAFVFAVLAWGVTAFLAYGSESNGIAGATVAMFPTGFGAAGVIVRKQELARVGGRPSAARLLAIATGGGVLAMLMFGGFMGAIWPSL
ncbi:MAG: hypothetical protein Q8O67_10340 [Deltaproteobacteria bacterium]|nr:hypothetical protein [Deltaproteobacteria bacterium]